MEAKTLIGVSLKVVAPTGQYDPAKLVNWGANRWGSTRLWLFQTVKQLGSGFVCRSMDLYGQSAVLLAPSAKPQTQRPIGSLKALELRRSNHGYGFVGRKFWFGGRYTAKWHSEPATRQKELRIGATASLPLGPHSLRKGQYNNGDYIRFGGTTKRLRFAGSTPAR